MNISADLALQILENFKKYNESAYQFFQELIYGKTILLYNKTLKKAIRGSLYLNQLNPQMMICLHETGKRDIFDIRRIFIQRANYRYQLEYGLQQGTYCMLKDQRQEIILIFPHRQNRQELVKGLKLLAKKFNQIPSQYDSTILKNFIQADQNQNLQLSKQQIKNILLKLKIQQTQQIKNILNFIKKSNKNTDNIGFKDFQKLAKILSCRQQFIYLYQNYAKIKFSSYSHYLQKLLKRQQFIQYLKYQQNQQDINNICQNIYGKNLKISFYDFCQYLTSSINNAININIYQQNIDSNLSLNQYYCYSSHNTYLTGNQLTSQSKVQRYLQDLEDGIRCVQIDAHDGNKQPIVKHGYTMTTSITFQDIIKTIKIFCQDNKNHTPIILSIQNHCSNENQLKMTQILQKYFSDKLLKIQGDKFPTLNQCMGKIIIKNVGSYKIYKKYIIMQLIDQKQKQIILQDQQADNKQQQIIQNPITRTQKQLYKVIDNVTKYPQHFKKHRNVFVSMIDYLQNDKRQFIQHQKKIQLLIRNSYQNHSTQTQKHLLNLRLLSITSMLSSGKIGQLSPWESVSLSQSKLIKYYQHQKDSIIESTKVGWARSYPLATRIDSSNYNPIPAFQMGIQIVALNTQNSDPYTHLLKQFFCLGKAKFPGYRPKVQFSSEQIQKTTLTALSAVKITQNKLTQQIPAVAIKMYFIGTKSDMLLNKQESISKKYTQTIKNNAFNPIFKYSERITVRYRRIQFAFIVIQIQECGMSVLPIQFLRKGIRSVVLYDKLLNPKQSKVMCLIE